MKQNNDNYDKNANLDNTMNNKSVLRPSLVYYFTFYKTIITEILRQNINYKVDTYIMKLLLF